MGAAVATPTPIAAPERREVIRCPACGKKVLTVVLPPGRAVINPYCARCKRVFTVVLS